MLVFATVHVISASLLSEGASTSILLSIEFVGAFSEYYNFILSLSVFPAAEYKEMGSDRCGGVAETRSGRIANVFATLPGHGVGAPNHKVVT